MDYAEGLCAVIVQGIVHRDCAQVVHGKARIVHGKARIVLRLCAGFVRRIVRGDCA